MIDEADRTVGTIVRSGVGESNTPSVDQMRRTGQSLEDWLRGENLSDSEPSDQTF